ncbi:MAG: c-type heme family protein [Pirellulales bacterium]
MRRVILLLLCLSVILGSSSRLHAEKPANKPSKQQAEQIEKAREKAKLVHKIYDATQDVIHHRYFRNDRSMIPARAMEDVFEEIARQEDIRARWISVNARAMNINHRPRDDFEKAAALAISARKNEYEAVEDGIYRRAEAIRLSGGCLTCHEKFGADPTTSRFAGLVISIPLELDEKQEDTKEQGAKD